MAHTPATPSGKWMAALQRGWTWFGPTDRCQQTLACTFPGTCFDLVQQMGEQAVSEFRFEPGALGRHQSTGVGHSDQVLNPGGEHREGTGGFSTVDQPLQFHRPSNATNKLD